MGRMFLSVPLPDAVRPYSRKLACKLCRIAGRFCEKGISGLFQTGGVKINLFFSCFSGESEETFHDPDELVVIAEEWD